LQKRKMTGGRVFPIAGAGGAAWILVALVCLLGVVIAAGGDNPLSALRSVVNAADKVATRASGDAARGEPAGEWQIARMRVTAYCPCEKCCGRYADGVTACGHVIQPGDVFAAADRRYSFGTQMIVPGYNNGRAVEVLDRGGAIRGGRLDVFFHSHQEALNWGVRYLDVKIRPAASADGGAG